MATAKYPDAFGRVDDGTDGRRSIARARAPRAPARLWRMTPRGTAVVAAVRAGFDPDVATVDVIVVPRSLVNKGTARTVVL